MTLDASRRQEELGLLSDYEYAGGEPQSRQSNAQMDYASLTLLSAEKDQQNLRHSLNVRGGPGGFHSVSNTSMKKQTSYEPMYSVKDPHLHFYHQCRPRDKSKEI